MDAKKKKRNLLIPYFIAFYILAILAVVIFQLVGFFGTAKELCRNVEDKGLYRLEDRISSTLDLVTSLSESKTISSEDVDGREKTRFLNGYSDSLGYMMICYVDRDMFVWDETGAVASLAGREYLQQLFLTGEPQVTDVFAAGADGKTLNYTIAAPIIKDGIVNGAVFAAVYYQELDDFIGKLTDETDSAALLFGSRAQVMHYSNINVSYGQYYIELAQNLRIMGENAKKIEENIVNKEPGAHWEFEGARLYYVTYAPVARTGWTFLSRIGLNVVMQRNALPFALALVITTALCAGLFALVYIYHKRRMETVNMLLESVAKLERQIYQNENPGDMDFRQIIKMTGKGLTDGLTGVVTRTVFMDRVVVKLAQNADKLSVVCFIDVDDLKLLNDTYGHEAGDRALKEIGYTLRKYEKRYDGMVGRYGGDEFVIYLTGFSHQEEIVETIEEITASLRSTLTVGEDEVVIHCSVGATVCKGNLTSALKAADEALYDVKRTGKGSYKLV